MPWMITTTVKETFLRVQLLQRLFIYLNQSICVGRFNPELNSTVFESSKKKALEIIKRFVCFFLFEFKIFLTDMLSRHFHLIREFQWSNASCFCMLSTSLSLLVYRFETFFVLALSLSLFLCLSFSLLLHFSFFFISDSSSLSVFP